MRVAPDAMQCENPCKFEFALKGRHCSRRGAVVEGGSPRATLWAVYDLVEHALHALRGALESYARVARNRTERKRVE